MHIDRRKLTHCQIKVNCITSLIVLLLLLSTALPLRASAQFLEPLIVFYRQEQQPDKRNHYIMNADEAGKLLLELAARKIERQSKAFGEYISSIGEYITINIKQSTNQVVSVSLLRRQERSEINAFNENTCAWGNSHAVPGLVGMFSKNKSTIRSGLDYAISVIIFRITQMLTCS
jgi:hypothetical protein